jgi:predicted DNA binding CopG/RHH family protein
MKKTKQFNKSENRLKPEDALKFLEDFQNTVHGRDTKTKSISLRVPENVLNTFKQAAKNQNKKYQSVIVQLMREWLKKNN